MHNPASIWHTFTMCALIDTHYHAKEHIWNSLNKKPVMVIFKHYFFITHVKRVSKHYLESSICMYGGGDNAIVHYKDLSFVLF